MDLEIVNKTALVSGSHRGTGEIIAATLAAEGARVLCHGIEEGDATRAAAKLANALPVWGDIATEPGCETVLAQIADIGGVDILVNNYGGAGRGSWFGSTTADWIDMYQKNVLSAVRLTQGLTPAMKRRGWGRVVLLGTIGSHQPNNILPDYYAAKGALATLAVSLARELGPSGITVNTVSPGYIKTPELEASFRRRAAKKGWGENWQDIERQIVASEFPNPRGRIAERQEVADLVAFLCSKRADFIHGQNIRIDGGAVRYV